MTIKQDAIEDWAAVIAEAQFGARAIPQLTIDNPQIDLAAGYAIQDALRRCYLARGDRLVGFKCGLTSKAKMIQMGVHEPGYGFLTSGMWRPDGGVIELGELIHPRVEAEIAFVLGDDLEGPGCTLDEVIAATDYVVPALEIIDSRYENFKFDLPSVMADNASSARFVVGGRTMPPAALDLRTLGVVLEKNGEIAALAAAAAVMGHPAAAVATLVNHLAARGERIAAGSIILSGGVTEAIAVGDGDHLCARVQSLGDVSVRFA